MTKTCTACGETKPWSEFHVIGENGNGTPKLRSNCRPCWTKRVRKYQTETVRGREIAKRQADRRSIRRYYGMSPEEYEELTTSLFEAQDGVCAICLKSGIGYKSKRPLLLDHDHASGRVRGLLCSPCNTGLGHLKDDIDVLLAAVAYLQRDYSANPVLPEHRSVKSGGVGT